MVATADIFISHSSEDDVFGRDLAGQLLQAFQGKTYEGHEVTVWYDATHIHTGERWVEEISSALASCSVFLLILSPEAIESDWVFDEFVTARSTNKKIIPILWRSCAEEISTNKRGRWTLLKAYQYSTISNKSAENTDTHKTVSQQVFRDLYQQIETHFGEKLQKVTEESKKSPEDRLMQQLLEILWKDFDHDKNHKHSRWDEVILLSDMLLHQMETIIPTDVYYMRGVALHNVGRYEEADASLALALALMRPNTHSKDSKETSKRREYLEARKSTLLKMHGRWKELYHVAMEAIKLLPDDREWASLYQQAKARIESNPSLKIAPLSTLAIKKLRQYSFGMCTLEGPTKAVTGLVWSRDCQYLAAASEDGNVYIWRAGELEKPKYIYSAHQKYVTAVAWSPYGKQFASASRDKTVHIWRLGEKEGTIWQHDNWVNDVAWSPNEVQLASACQDRTVRIWDVSRGKQEQGELKHDAVVRTIAWHQDEIHLAVGCDNGEVCIWDTQTGSQIKLAGEKRGLIYDLIWLPESESLLAASDDKHVYVWEHVLQGATRYKKVNHEEIVFAVTHSFNGTYIASSNGREVRVWERESEKQIFRNLVHSGRVRALAWAPDDLHIASAGEDRLVQVWHFIQPTQKDSAFQE